MARCASGTSPSPVLRVRWSASTAPSVLECGNWVRMAEGRTTERPGMVAALRALLSVVGPRRRLQLYVTLVLTLLGAVAELVTIGAVLPLLALASTEGGAAQAPVIGPALKSISIGGEGGMISAAALLITAAIVA